MRAQYEAAARYPTAFYGQLARARLGLGDVTLRAAPRSVNADASAQGLKAFSRIPSCEVPTHRVFDDFNPALVG
jgi:hypothetical protein